jgi:hypothetical protein
MKNAVFWDVKPCGPCMGRLWQENIGSVVRVQESESSIMLRALEKASQLFEMHAAQTMDNMSCMK